MIHRYNISGKVFQFSRIRNSKFCAKTTDFGYKTVNTEEKEHLVKDVFSKVAQKYDIMNDLMSAGIHRFWKDDFVHMLGIKALKSSPQLITSCPRHLDVAGGTGDIAFRSAEHISESFHTLLESSIYNKAETLPHSERPVVVCDINPNMLAVGQDRASTVLGNKRAKIVGFVEGNAESLPFPDNSFDFYTIAFGLRNVTNKDVRIHVPLLITITVCILIIPSKYLYVYMHVYKHVYVPIESVSRCISCASTRWQDSNTGI
jgi:2-methoxy-6-polyprenyl-1,4-benzoquinol methylase